MRQIDDIVVGAGIWGCTVARLLAEHGRKVLVLERREAIGGNCRCEIDPDTGIEVHVYGCHIFHTSLDDVWTFINRFTDFNEYQHRCIAIYDNKPYFLPLGLTLVNQFYGLNLTPSELPAFLKNEIGDVLNPEENFETKAISLIGKRLYNAFIRGYTKKQWGRDPKELSANIIKRLPVRTNYDLSYYNDIHQGIPIKGYSEMFKNMLNHPNITVETGIGFKEWMKKQSDELKSLPIFYSGAIDELFDYKYGVLPWRSLRFEFETLDIQDHQGTSVMNYPEENVPYTRIHEFKHFHPEQRDVMNLDKTIICREYPDEWKIGKEKYYPIENAESSRILGLYQEEAKKHPNLIMGGRCGNYKYYDMDKAVKNAIDTVNFRTFNQ